MTRISTEYERVMREGLQPRAVGADQGAGMKDRESAGKRSIPEFAATSRGGPAQMTRGGVGMTISGARVVRTWPRLMVIDGGKQA